MKFAVKSEERYWGPFDTASQAAKWADESLAQGCQWWIIPLKSPDE